MHLRGYVTRAAQGAADGHVVRNANFAKIRLFLSENFNLL